MLMIELYYKSLYYLKRILYTYDGIENIRYFRFNGFWCDANTLLLYRTMSDLKSKNNGYLTDEGGFDT